MQAPRGGTWDGAGVVANVRRTLDTGQHLGGDDSSGSWPNRSRSSTVAAVLDDVDSVSAVAGHLWQVLESLHEVPALIRTRHLDVLASNELAQRLSAGFQPGVNMARFTFFNPEVATSTDNWGKIARMSAGCLRTSLHTHHEDADFRMLIGELAAFSDDFSQAWARQESDDTGGGYFSLEHAIVGHLSMAYQQLQGLHDPDGTALVIYRPVGETSRRKLHQLRQMDAA
jgi:hypothetical protein